MSHIQHVALVGNPNCGKTSLFNQLTGARQKVANYAGVTVERKEGFVNLRSGRRVRILDLPGAYSLEATSPDEAITRAICLGEFADETPPDVLVCVVDATNLRLHLRFVLEVKALGRPMLLVLNMMDDAKRRAIQIDTAKLAQLLGVNIIETAAVKRQGIDQLLAHLDQHVPPIATPMRDKNVDIHQHVRDILAQTLVMPRDTDQRDDFLDSILLHPVAGLAILAVLMFFIFQAVFAWAAPFMDGIEWLVTWLSEGIGQHMADGLLKGLLIDAVLAGVGGVLVFLPQILILFFFILALEESGYLPRAAFLLDRLMFKAGLTGRAFIPLLSSFACAVPGIMATRSISDTRDRLTTIMVAPLMTCSARLPVYALLIGAFVPAQTVAGLFNLQGLVLFGLYFGGIFSALLVATIIKWFRKDKSEHALLLELPSYRFPDWHNILLGLYERAGIFIKRVGGIILALTILLWVLLTFPQAPADATMPAIDYSFAGRIGHALAVVFEPIGFTWQICIALIPAMAAREVVVSALGTVYAIAGDDEVISQQLGTVITDQWSLATALSLLVWFVFAPQCIATLATVKRETASWRTVAIMAVYLFATAYLASLITYRMVLAFS
ncbi:ferrous iron transporter B [Agitococcus lubricus]|uniref:Fe(2+) transporter FeoB n=1 Tax=Agitococcus lubricus TaxID=1077255 RepID=A0A2T5IUJ0_9GAMM|nr:ferrous iron transporter B [Agitococcus lubricus]PTQ87544.1 ferrous iron transport protein B [Agitococcus lubricus]